MKKFRDVLVGVRRRAWLALHRSVYTEGSQRDRPRLLVDLSVIARHDARTGIQRVVRGIWAELNSRTHVDYDFVPVYASRTRGYCYARPSQHPEKLKLTRDVVSCREGDKFLGLDLSAHYLPHWVGQFAGWRNAGATIHNVVYDLLPLRQPEWFTVATRKHFKRWFEAVKSQSDQLLCISDDVANEVRKEISPSTRPAVGRLCLSGNIAGSVPSRGMSADMVDLVSSVASTPTVLMVGTVEPRKGYDAALAAFDLLWRSHPGSAPNLFIVGKAGWRTDELQRRLNSHPENDKRLFWRSKVSDEALTELYENCAAVLSTSRGEGFGLPLSEAAAHRKWMLARDLPVFREQQLPNCLFFADESPPALGEKILELMALAAESAPPTAHLPDWTDCLQSLLRSLGIDPDGLQHGPDEAA